MRRDWSQLDPVEYFRERYEGKITTRGQLAQKDGGLYDALREQGKLDQVLKSQQENNRNWDEIEPVEYFNKHYKNKVTTRKQLRTQDGGLYQILKKQGKLDQILPNTQENNRDWKKTDPEKYFKEKYEGKVTSRKQLQKKDRVLYNKLLKQGKLDQILPNTNQKHRDWNKTNPVEYFNKHYKGKITTRKQLADKEKGDLGLYAALLKQGRLDEVLPNQHKDRRNWNEIDPEQYFKDKYEGKITTRIQLKKQDRGLYSILGKQGKLDLIFPPPNQKEILEKLLQNYTNEIEKQELERLLQEYNEGLEDKLEGD